jgi:hypothetical protein
MPPRNPDRDAPPFVDSSPLDAVSDEWSILVACWKCSHSAAVRPQLMARKVGQGGTVGQLKGRLRCRQCGERGGRLSLLFVGKPRR